MPVIPKAWRLQKATPPPGGSRFTAHGSLSFTLVELMVVLGVIVILASLLYPVIMKARTRTLEKQAVGEVKSIEAALRAYRGVYGQWPGQTNDTGDVTYVFNNAPVIGALTTNNPRGIVFLQIQQRSIVTNNPDNAGTMVDPWGVPYIVALDQDFNNETVVNTDTNTFTNAQGRVFTGLSMIFKLNDSVAVASWGSAPSSAKNVSDGNYLTVDIPCSWQAGRKTK